MILEDRHIRFFLTGVLASLILILLTYPASPFLFQLFVGNRHAAYAVMAAALVIVAFCLKNNRLYVKSKLPVDSCYFINIGVLFSIILTISMTGSISPIRDLIIIAVILFFLFLVRGTAYLSVIRCYCMVCAVICACCTFTYLLYVIYPSLQADWIVTSITLSADNPILSRHEMGDFEYSLLFHVGSLLTDPDSGLNIIPAFFTEPTYVFAYMSAPFFFAVMDKGMTGRYFIFLSLLISLALVVSTYTLIIMLLSLTLIFLSSISRIFSKRNLTYSGIVIILLLVFYEPFLQWALSLLPLAKASQFDYYFGARLTESLAGGLSLFGRELDEFQPRSWGSSIVLFRYGIVGFSLFLASVLFYILLSLQLLFNTTMSRRERICSFLMMFVTALMALKSPNLLLLTNLLFYVGLINYLALSSDRVYVERRMSSSFR